MLSSRPRTQKFSVLEDLRRNSCTASWCFAVLPPPRCVTAGCLNPHHARSAATCRGASRHPA